MLQYVSHIADGKSAAMCDQSFLQAFRWQNLQSLKSWYSSALQVDKIHEPGCIMHDGIMMIVCIVVLQLPLCTQFRRISLLLV